MTTKMVLIFLAFAVVSLALMSVFLCIRVKKGACAKALIFKTLASLVFVVGGLTCAQIVGLNVQNLLVVIGLVCAMLGDIVLDLKQMHPENNKIYLNSGIAVFSVSSLLYVVSTCLWFNMLEKFWFLFGGALLISVLVAIVIFLLEKPLKLNFAGYKVQVFIYSLLVTMAAILSLAICLFIEGFAVFAVGALLILISDLVLSMTYFGTPKKPNTLVVINHILYYLGELMIVCYLFIQVL